MEAARRMRNVGEIAVKIAATIIVVAIALIIIAAPWVDVSLVMQSMICTSGEGTYRAMPCAKSISWEVFAPSRYIAGNLLRIGVMQNGTLYFGGVDYFCNKSAPEFARDTCKLARNTNATGLIREFEFILVIAAFAAAIITHEVKDHRVTLVALVLVMIGTLLGLASMSDQAVFIRQYGRARITPNFAISFVTVSIEFIVGIVCAMRTMYTLRHPRAPQPQPPMLPADIAMTVVRVSEYRKSELNAGAGA